MLWAVFTHLAGFIVDLVGGARRAEQAKDLEIAVPCGKCITLGESAHAASR